MLFQGNLNELIFERQSEIKEKKQTSMYMYLIVHTARALKTVYLLVYF